MNNQNPYTQSKRINPNNTGSMWCAKNAKDWSKTTHFEYYKNDPQVALGGLLLLIILGIIGLFIFITVASSSSFGLVLLAIILGVFIGTKDLRKRRK